MAKIAVIFVLNTLSFLFTSGVSKGRFLRRGGGISTIGLVRVPVAIVNFAFCAGVPLLNPINSKVFTKIRRTIFIIATGVRTTPTLRARNLKKNSLAWSFLSRLKASISTIPYIALRTGLSLACSSGIFHVYLPRHGYRDVVRCLGWKLQSRASLEIFNLACLQLCTLSTSL